MEIHATAESKIKVSRPWATAVVLPAGTAFRTRNGSFFYSIKDVIIQPSGWFTRLMLWLFPRWPFGQSISIKAQS